MPQTMAFYQGPYHMSRAELRKSNKPIMEKRRRARINTCLNELKTLILDAMKKDPARHSKLEKADILEMTVKHLQDIQREQMRSAVAGDPSVITKFHSGFSECADEVSRYVSRLEGVDDGVKRRLMGHLNGCVSGLNQVLPLAGTNPNAEDVNNNDNTAQRLLGGMQLVPSRLPTGELAILIPNMDSREAIQREHRSAFRVVARPSPGVSPAASTTSIDSDHVTSTSPDLTPLHSGHSFLSPRQVLGTPGDMTPKREPLASPTFHSQAMDLKSSAHLVTTVHNVDANPHSPQVTIQVDTKPTLQSSSIHAQALDLKSTSPVVTIPVAPLSPPPTSQVTQPSTSRDMWRPW